jgi:hypothetical protein
MNWLRAITRKRLFIDLVGAEIVPIVVISIVLGLLVLDLALFEAF